MSYQANRFQGALTYFHSRQTDSIVMNTTRFDGSMRIWAKPRFRDLNWKANYYLGKTFFLTGSVSYQANHDGNGISNVTPVPNLGVKGGLVTAGENGLTLSIFDNYQGDLRGFTEPR